MTKISVQRIDVVRANHAAKSETFPSPDTKESPSCIYNYYVELGGWSLWP